MNFVHNDGGRAEAGFKGSTRDCVVRAIAIAMQRPYAEVYRDIQDFAGASAARKGVPKPLIRRYMQDHAWTWVSTMAIGQGCKVHLCKDELPTGRLVVSVSRHLVAMINGVVHDTHDPGRSGKRCVYGYFHLAT
jgi:hypothetical protein